MFENKRTVRAPDGRLIIIDQSGVFTQPGTNSAHRQSAIAAGEVCQGDPSQVGAKIDPGQHGAKIDPSQLGAKIDPAQVGAKIQPTA
ncbi:hypothetical protein [Ruegeria profundi]|uniref:hypothetical protein n=1 Tax=Ruegeria profundi TaxID=1685378 RepID=UPI003C7D3554